MTDYTKILPKGRNNAVSASALARMLRFRSTRELRLDIKRSRDAGQIICSTCSRDGGGYYIPATQEELTVFIKMMERHAKSTFSSLRAARSLMRQTDGQLTLDGIRDRQK